MELAGKGKKKTKQQQEEEKKSKGGKKLSGHSATVQQRIAVVEGRVYVHPIPQFMDNIAYLIVCLPPPVPSRSGGDALPILGVLIDCGESTKVLEYMEWIYDHHYARDYPRNRYGKKGGGQGIELYSILCTHRHHDHTAGVGPLKKELVERRLEEHSTGGEKNISIGAGGSDESNVYKQAPGNVLVVGGAVENVPHCNLFVKNGCFVPLPCVSVRNNYGDASLENGQGGNGSQLVNDMNAVVSIEVIGVPSHTRGSVVYALRNRAAPDYITPTSWLETPHQSPTLQSHLFTGDAIFTGGGGVPFEAELEYNRDNFTKNPKKLSGKNGSSKFRPGAGVLSMERCFAEVLTRANGPWSSSSLAVPQDATSSYQSTKTLIYPGHEYTTDLLLRQFDQKTTLPEGQWTRLSPSIFFETASHYLVSAHRRSLPPTQKLLTVPTPLDRERVVNPNFRSLARRGECLVNALRLWYEFGARGLIPDIEEEEDDDDVANDDNKSAEEEEKIRKLKLKIEGMGVSLDEDDGIVNGSKLEDDHDATATKKQQTQSVFTTVYSADLDNIVNELRSGNIDATSAAEQIESLRSRLDDKLIGRRPIPRTLPSHKNVYLGVVALAVLGSAPSAVTVSDANIMDMAPPIDCTDRMLVSRRRVSSVACCQPFEMYYIACTQC